MSATRINLDYTSGTPVMAAVAAAMAEAPGGNPSAIHEMGRNARHAVEQARKRVGVLINAKPEEIFFTSCGTESNNWGLRGLYAANKRKGHSLDSPRQERGSLGTPPHGAIREAPHVILSAIEHPSVSLAAKRLELEGAQISVLRVDSEGLVSPSDLKAALTPQTIVVSVMLANGEVGTIEPIRELASIAHAQGALFHTDAIAAVGHVPVDARALGVDALSLAANQFGGPQGAAALFVREGVRILPLIEGGGQEHGGRSGTENVAAIVGMGAAAEIARRDLPHRQPRETALRDRLREELASRLEGIRWNGSWTSRLPHNLHLCVDGVSSESLVLGLDQAGITAGLGSACNSKSMRPSHVLKAMGLTDEQAKGALVLTLGEPTTDDEIARAVEAIPRVVEQLRRVTKLTART